MMRPVRKSSEAPEVVPSQPDLFVADAQSNLEMFKRKKGTQYEKQVANVQSPGLDARSPRSHTPGDGGGYKTPASASSPRGTEREYQTPGPLYDLSAYEVSVAADLPRRDRRVCGLITTIILVTMAFIIGGGVGGGIGGAIAVNNKDKTSASSSASSTTSSPPIATSAPPSTTTIVVDVAGCPNINDTTYNSTFMPYTFLQACATDIKAPTGQNIDVADKFESSFDACLDYCAQYTGNSTTKGQCVAVTWVIYSASEPEKNSRCYLKNSTGVAIPQSSGQLLATGFLNNT